MDDDATRRECRVCAEDRYWDCGALRQKRQQARGVCDMSAIHQRVGIRR